MLKTTTSTINTTRKQYPLYLVLAGIALAIWLILRLVLWLDVGPSQLSALQTLKAFAVGAWFDINALCFLLVPFLLLSLVVPNSWRSKNWLNKARWILAFFVTFGLLFGAVSEYIFWQEFTTRFNFIAVDYLIYTTEVIGNIRESYPVPLLLGAIALVALAILWAVSRFVRFDSKLLPFKRKAKLLIAAILLPMLSFQLANVDQMEIGKNAYANELAGNGVYSFSAAARRNELDYDKFYKTIPDALALSTLSSVGLNRETAANGMPLQANNHAASSHAVKLSPFKRSPKNVVLISIESLSAEYVGVYGNKQNLTPYLDKLAAESLMFDKFFATGTRTVRGLDALSIAIPPIPGQAIVHRPENAHLNTIGEVLRAQNYETYFIYGGYGVFDNMNNYYRANNYKVVDRTDFDKSTIQAENVWGVDDESLFNNSIKIFDENAKTGKPFFAQIMTTTNHRPYTFPEGKIDLPQGNREGAVKYTDYAIGKFIEDSKSKPWFKDTVFVIVADHCASVAGKTKLPVNKYHIPLFIYAPDMLPAGHYSRMASQIDIVPTLLDVLGTKGSEQFYGQSMFKAAAENQPERAFISNYQSLGYLKNSTLIVLSPKQKTEAFAVDANMDSTPSNMDETLLNEAIAYYQSASRDFKTGALKLKPVK
jgi:phosphoglycerol transferase MdoB-like AlkP superfamily enzyme